MTYKVLAVSFLTLAAIPAATLSIQPSSSTISVGQTANVSVNISNVSDLFAFQFDIGFNPAVLSAASVSEGPFLPSGGTTTFVPGTIDNVGGLISFTADALNGAIPGVSGSGMLATLHFNAFAVGTSPITLENVTLLDSNFGSIDFTSTAGRINVVVPEPGPALTLLTGLLTLLALSGSRIAR